MLLTPNTVTTVKNGRSGSSELDLVTKAIGDNNPSSIFGVDRGLLGQLFNATAINAEDFNRQLYLLEKGNLFNSMEAKKQREFEEKLSNTAYSRAVADMKKSGINPILGLGMANHANIPSGASASSSSVAGVPSTSSFALQLVSSLASIIAGVYTSGASNAVKQSIASANNANRLAVANTVRKSENYNQTWIHNSRKKK